MDDTNHKNWITVTRGLDPSVVRLPKLYQGCIESVVLQEKEIKARIKDLTTQIADHYCDRPFVIMIVLKGSFLVFTEIYQNLVEIYNAGKHNNVIVPEFVRLKSYKNDSKTDKTMIQGLEGLDLEGKEVLIIEDMIESGDTMRTLLKVMKEIKKPKDIKIFSLVVKEGKTHFEFNVDYVGFEIPNKFCVGFGIDYNEQFRDLYCICTLNQYGLDKFRV